MKQKRSLFLPHSSTIMSMNMGPIYPCLVREMYPNDKIIISHEALLRAAPMLFPLYSPVKLTFDYFFSENRLVWKGDEEDDWSTFITGSVNGKAITDLDDMPEHPWLTVPSGGFANGSLADYLGFCSGSRLAGAKISALRFRHYQQIIKDYYIDENFSTPPTIAYTSGEDTTTSLSLAYRCWNKDRFTTATAEPQKGLDIGVPLSGDIPVCGNGKTLGLTNGAANFGLQSKAEDSNVRLFQDAAYYQNVSSTATSGALTTRTGVIGVTTDATKSGIIAKLSEATTIPIDELHWLTQIERLNQRDNQWGSRDFECIRTHFGCWIPDTRLQRATHLGRTVVDVNFSEVLQTSQSSETSAQGNITGHTLAVSQNHPVRYHALEHGFLFVMVNIQPIAQYQDGIPRDAMYQTRYDYMWPILSETGEQGLFAAEVFGNEANVRTRKIFGFEPIYNHLRFGEKTVHGDFRGNLSGYHAGRIFANEPNLGENFVTASDVTKRMFAVELQEVDAFWLRCEFNIKHVRRLPKWPNPSAIGKLF